MDAPRHLDPRDDGHTDDARSDRAAPEWLEESLDAAVRAERDLPPPDAERFLARLRPRLSPVPGRPRARFAAAFALAAMIPIAIVLFALFGGPGPADDPAPGSLAVADAEILEELDLLVLLAELSDSEGDELDPELIELYLDYEIVDELPVEVLGSSG